MSRESIFETVHVATVEAGAPVETVVERIVTTELVTEHIGPPGQRGPADGETLRRDLDGIDDLSLLFDNGLI